jgi:hypothetical protein
LVDSTWCRVAGQGAGRSEAAGVFFENNVVLSNLMPSVDKRFKRLVVAEALMA